MLEHLVTERLAAWRRAYRETQAGGSPSCPTDEELAGLVLGEVQGAERERLADHVLTCRACTEAYQTLNELAREVGPPARSRTHTNRPIWLAAAATLVLGIGLIELWQLTHPSTVREFPEGDEILRSVAPAEGSVQPAPEVTLASSPELFSWPPSPGAAGYRLIVHDADGEPVWTSPEVRSSQLEVPMELAALLTAGESYYWTVDVLGTGTGERLGPFWFTLGPTAAGADGE